MKSFLPKLLLILISAVLLSAESCVFIGEEPNYAGFHIRTLEASRSGFGFPVVAYAPGIYLSGNWRADIGYAFAGLTNPFFNGFTDSVGGAFVNYGRAPAYWGWVFGNGPCRSQVLQTEVYPDAETQIVCQNVFGSPSSITPASVNASLGMQYLTVADGQSIDGTYGRPKVWLLDPGGTTLIQAEADTWTSDGTSASAYLDMSSVYSGDYVVLVRNVNGDGTLTTVSVAALSVYGHDYPVWDPPPDPCEGACPVNP